MKQQLLAGKHSVILLLIVLLPALSKAQYCNTSYSSSQCINYDMYIQDFKTTGGVTNITNTSSGCGNTSTSYIYYNTMKHAGVQGTAVYFTVKIGQTYAQGVRIWVDYNADGDFSDAGEAVYNPSSTISGNGSVSSSFTIPANATPGVTRMRVRSSYATTGFSECGSQSYGECEDYVFEVVPSCSAKFTTPPSDSKACENGDVLFTAAGIKTDSFNWQANYGSGWVLLGDDLNHSGTTTDSLVVKNLAMGMDGFQYRAVAINKTEGCSVNSLPATLDMVASSSASIVIAPNPGNIVCEETEVTLYTTWSNGGTTPKYQWMINGQDVPGATAGTFKTGKLANGDIVECRFMSSAICVPAKLSNPVEFNVNPLLTPYVDMNVTYEGGNTYTYTAIPTNGGVSPTYIWYRNNVMAGGVNGDTYTITDAKPYDKIIVKMVSDAPCVHPGSVMVSSNVFLTGINDNKTAMLAFNVTPNPNNGQFSLSGKLPVGAKDVTITITNAVGQVVATYNYHADNGILNMPVKVDNLTNGLYNAQVKTKNNMSNTRFVVAK